jgi:hypothetical protein
MCRWRLSKWAALATGDLWDHFGDTGAFTFPASYVLALMPFPPAARTDPPPPRPAP